MCHTTKELQQQENINKDLAMVTPHRNIEENNQEKNLLNEESTPLVTIKLIPKPRKPKMKQQNREDPTLSKLMNYQQEKLKLKSRRVT